MFLILSTILLVSARIAESTTQNGVTAGTNYNQYLELGGQSGFKFEDIPSFEPASSSKDFTLLAWFKIDAYPWDVQHDFNIIDIKDRLRCQIKTNARLDCQSAEQTRGFQTGPFQASLDFGLQLEEWYLMVLASQDGESTLSLYDLSFQQSFDSTADGPIVSETADFDPFKAVDSSDTQDLFIGIEADGSNDMSFVGSIRQVIAVSAYLNSDSSVKNAAFNFLEKQGEPDLMFQATLFNASTGIQDSFSQVKADLIGSKIVPKADTGSQYLCWKVSETQIYQMFQFKAGSSTQLKSFSIPSELYNPSDDFTLKAWIYRDTDYNLPSQSEVLFEHSGVMSLKFLSNDYGMLTVTQNGETIKVPAPRGIWLWLVSWHTDDSFGVQLQDIHGNVYSDGSQAISASGSSSASGSVKIGSQFSGFIEGLKYYSTDDVSFSAENFKHELDPDGYLLFYFMFANAESVLSSHEPDMLIGSKFQNFKSGYDSETYALGVNGNPAARFGGITWYELGQRSLYGTLSSSIGWDGISCKSLNPFETGGLMLTDLLYFSDEYGYASSSFDLTGSSEVDSVDAITVEFWFRFAADHSADLIDKRSLVTVETNGEAIFMIEERNGHIVCLPLQNHFGENIDYGLELADFDETTAYSEFWHHVSCSIDKSNQRIQGTLLRHDWEMQEHGYLKHDASFVERFRLFDPEATSNQVSVRINADSGGDPGGKDIFYCDVRVWSGSRSLEQIKANRYQLQDYQAQGSNIFSAMQFLSGGDMFSFEPDLGRIVTGMTISQSLSGQSTYPTVVKFRNNIWKTDRQSNRYGSQAFKSLVLCPLKTFISSDQQSCIRDSLKELRPLTMKANTDGPFIIAANLSQMEQNYQLKTFDQSHDFLWSIDQVRDGASDQPLLQAVLDTNDYSQLVLDQSVVEDGAQYSMTLEASDVAMRQQRPVESSFWFTSINDCIYLRDTSTLSAFVDMPVKFSKSSQDLQLFFEMGGCQKYKASDPTLSVEFLDWSPSTELQEAIDLGIIAIQSSSNDQLNGQITISTAMQQEMPLNSPIYLILTATWNNRLSLSMVYKISFDSRVIVKLTPQSNIVNKDNYMIVYSYESEVINFDGAAGTDTFKLKWECENAEFCQPAIDGMQTAAEQQTLAVSYTDFELSGQNFWQFYWVKAVSYSSFIQGDGTWTGEDRTEIKWIDLDPKARLIGPSEIPADQPIVIRLETSGLDMSEIDYSWSSEPAINNLDALVQGSESARYVLAPDSDALIEDTDYVFRVVARLASTGEIFYEGEQHIRVIAPLRDGKLVVSPFQATSFTEIVELSTTGWSFRRGATTYQFLYIDEYGIEVPLTAYQFSRRYSTPLPQTDRIIVRIISVPNDERYEIERQVREYDVFLDGGEPSEENMIEELEGPDGAFVTGNINARLLTFLRYAHAVVASENKERSRQLLTQMLEGLRPGEAGTTDDFRLQASLGVIGILSRGHDIFQNSTVNDMQALAQELFDTQTDEQLVAYMRQQDPQLPGRLIEITTNLQAKTEQELFNNEVESMIYGFKNAKLMEHTTMIRDMLVKLERVVGIYLQVDEVYEYQSNSISFKTEKYSSEDVQSNSVKSSFRQLGFTLPLQNAEFTTDEQSLTYIVLSSNVFEGSNYMAGDMIQEVYANYTLYVSWRGDNGNDLSKSNFPGAITFDIKYDFEEFKISPRKELELMSCVHMSPGDDTFSKEACTTDTDYARQRVTCTCNQLGFFTVARDEYYRPYDKVSGNFQFQNWQSFALFFYLILVAIFGLLSSSNYDGRDLAKLNDIDEQGDFTLASGDNAGANFPLLSYALKRQVNMMNYIDADETAALDTAVMAIPTKRLFILCMINFHPLVASFMQFQPTLPRQDRFLLFFLQLSIVCFLSFFLLRDFDRSSELTDSRAIATNLEIAEEELKKDVYGNLTLPIVLTILFSFLLLPMPNYVAHCLKKQFNLEEIDEDETDEEDEQAEGGEISTLVVNPEMPIKLLFQISAFPLDYLQSGKKSSIRRFPFLSPSTYGFSAHKAAIAKALVGAEQKKLDNERRAKELAEQAAEEREKKEKEARKREKRKRREERKRAEEEKKKRPFASTSKKEQNSFEVDHSDQKLIDRGSFLKADMMEGGSHTDMNVRSDESSSVTDLDELEETQKEFYEDYKASQGWPRAFRLLVWLGIIGLNIILLILYSIEGIHNTKGSLIWVLVFFFAQLMSFLVITPLYLFLHSAWVARAYAASMGDDEWLLKSLTGVSYDLMVLAEDWRHVVRFQTSQG